MNKSAKKPPRAGRKGVWGFRILALALPLLAVLLILEIVLRVFFPLYPVGILEAHAYDADFGYRVKPGHYTDVTDHRQELRVNQLGTVNYQEDFSGYDRLIFALGDSYTQGTGNPSDVAYPFQFDLIVNRDEAGSYVKRYGVVNLGLAAFGAKQSLTALRRYAERLGKPAVVLYLGCRNDAEDDVLFELGYHHHHLVDGSPRWGPLVRPMQLLSRLQILQRLKVAFASARRARLFDDAEIPGETAMLSVAERQWPVIEEIRREAEAMGAQFVVSWIPDEPSYEWLRAEAQKQGIAFADWYPAAQSVLASIDTVPLKNEHSGGHYRAWVYRIIAEEFARQIVGASDEASAGPP